MKTHFKAGLLAVILVTLGSFTGAGAELLLNPAFIQSDYAGAVALNISGLPGIQTVLVERFPDYDHTGVIPTNESSFQTFQVTDGAVPLLLGERNPNQPGDEDGSANGQLRVAWNISFAKVNQQVGNWLIRISSPSNQFEPVIQPMTIVSAFTAQGVQGTVTDGASPQGLARVMALDPHNSSELAMVFADTNGAYTLNLAPGSYLLAAFKTGFVTALGQAPVVTLGSGQTLTQNLSLLAADRAIDGQLRDATTASGIPSVRLRIQSDTRLATETHTDADGNFHAPVVAGKWTVEPVIEELAGTGHCGLSQLPVIDTTPGDASGVILLAPKATAIIRGTVKDSFNRTVFGLSMDGSGTNVNTRAYAMTDPFGAYFLGVDEGRWTIGVPSDVMVVRGYLGLSTNVTLDVINGDVQIQDFTLQRATAHWRGKVLNQYGAAIAGLRLTANGPDGYFSFGRSALDGSFDLGLAGGAWTVGPDSTEASQRGLQGTNLALTLADGVDLDVNLVLQDPNATQPPLPPVLTALGAPAAGQFQLLISGETGRNYRIEATTDWLTWFAVTHLTTTSNAVVYTDTTATNNARFYRVAVE